MPDQKMKIGIMSREEYQKRTIAIAKGEYRLSPNEPRVWFESIESMAQVLSGKNQELLRLIQDHRPASLNALATLSGRNKSNLSRTLKTMSNYGLVDLMHKGRTIQPVVKASQFQVEFNI
ncbi:MAG: transcriptional regulator [Clostridia bacterium]|nr:MAG: transcriptional regulator [Clostridia bacterium]